MCNCEPTVVNGSLNRMQRSVVSRSAGPYHLPQYTDARNLVSRTNLSDSITWESLPQYDGWGWWGNYWNCNDWILWHNALKQKFGINEANRIFITAYHDAGFGAASYDCRTFNSDFVTYAKNNGFYSALFAGLSALIFMPVSTTIHTGTTAVDTLTNSLKYVKWIAIGGLALYVYNKAV